MLHVRKPSEEQRHALLRRMATTEPTYAPLGGTLTGHVPAGLRHHRWATTLPAGSFVRAREVLTAWSMHRGSGLEVTTDGPVAEGTNVVMSAPLPVGWVDVTCRVVAVVDEPQRFGFAYGTLPVHPERGEEAFVVSVEADGTVSFCVAAHSTPAHPLARAAGPIADAMQDRAVRRYLRTMEALTLSA